MKFNVTLTKVNEFVFEIDDSIKEEFISKWFAGDADDKLKEAINGYLLKYIDGKAPDEKGIFVEWSKVNDEHHEIVVWEDFVY